MGRCDGTADVSDRREDVGKLRHLRYFATVADERHFGRASALLHITQSTLSTQVQALEREVGGLLFTRTSRRVELTEAGELLLPEARRALAQADRALQVARRSVRGETGAVRIGFSGVAVLQDALSDDLRLFHQAPESPWCGFRWVRCDHGALLGSPVHHAEPAMRRECCP